MDHETKILVKIFFVLFGFVFTYMAIEDLFDTDETIARTEK